MPHPATPAHPSTPASTPVEADADTRDFADFIAGQDPLNVAAAAWMVRRHDGLTPEEEAELREWLAADPAHADALERLERVWGRMDEIPPEGVGSLKASLSEHEACASTPPLAQPQSLPARPLERPAQPWRPLESPGRRAWFLDLGRLAPQVATVAVAFAMLGGGWYGWEAWQRQPVFSQSLATARGTQQEINLPDGSSLWLDTATRAEVSFYRQRREVRLSEGQVLFTVQADANRPFDVLAGPLRITVVGTRFSVRRTTTGLLDSGVSVAVEEGRVRVARSGGEARELSVPSAEPVELVAGQSIAADADGRLGAVAFAPAGASTAWREGRVNFTGAPLTQALAELERYGDTRLVVRDPAVAALRVHGSFDLRGLDAFARALPQVLPVRLRPVDGVIEIVGASRN